MSKAYDKVMAGLGDAQGYFKRKPPLEELLGVDFDHPDHPGEQRLPQTALPFHSLFRYS